MGDVLKMEDLEGENRLQRVVYSGKHGQPSYALEWDSVSDYITIRKQYQQTLQTSPIAKVPFVYMISNEILPHKLWYDDVRKLYKVFIPVRVP